jgi:hypothetical protein
MDNFDVLLYVAVAVATIKPRYEKQFCVKKMIERKKPVPRNWLF